MRRCRWAVPVLIFTLLARSPSPAAGQWTDGYSVAVGAHALTVPWYPGPVADRYNPAVMAGMDLTWKSRENWRLYYAVNLGFFRHHWWMTGISVEPEIGISREVAGGVHAQVGLGMGYLHYFWRRKTMELKDGRYVEATDLGSPSMIFPLSLTLGYRGDAHDPVSVAPFLTARWGVQALLQEEVPIMTHFQLLGGIRVKRGGSGHRGGE